MNTDIIRTIADDEVLKAAQAVEAINLRNWGEVGCWTAVRIYIHIFPENSGYRTKQCGVSAAVKRLARKGVIERAPGSARGRYRIKENNLTN